MDNSPGGLILRALGDEHPTVALGRLPRTPSVVRLLGQLFVVALRRGFADRDAREVTGYVRGLLTCLGRPAHGRSARQTEAVIRAALGEPALAAGIGPVRRHEIICTVVGDLARPSGPGHADLAALVTQAEQRVERFHSPAAGATRR